MAIRTFTESGDTATIADNNVSVFGASGTGTETVRIQSGVTGTNLDANIERIELSGNVADYQFVFVAGSGIQIQNASGTIIGVIPSLNQTATIAFADGSASMAQTGGSTFTLGGQTISADTAAPSTFTTTTSGFTFDTTDLSTVADSTTTSAGSTFTLTNSTSPDVISGTTGNDTITGASGTFASTDVITDASTTDSDTITVTTSTAAASLVPTVINIETISLVGTFNTVGITLTSVTGTNVLNLSSSITSGTATVLDADVTSVDKIVVGSNIATLNITAATTGTVGTLVVDAGSATTVAFTAASAADDVQLITNGAVSVTGGVAIETLELNSAAASSVTLDAIGTTLDVTGSNNVTLISPLLTGEAVANSLTSGATLHVVNTATDAVDLSKIAADSFETGAALAANSLTLATGASLKVTANLGNAASTITSAAATASTNTMDVEFTSSAQTGVVFENIKTANITAAAPTVTGTDLTFTVLDAGTNDITVAGTNDVQVTAGTAANVDASGLAGILTYTQAAAVDTSVKGGTGANVISLVGTTHNSVYTGQNAGETVTVATTTGIASITTGSGEDTIVADAITTGTLSANLGDANDTISATALTTGVISADLGNGTNTVTLGIAVTGAVTIAIVGGTGTDTLILGAAADISGGALSLTNVENIALAATGTITFSAAQLSGQTFNIQGTATTATDILAVTGVTSTTVIDLSNIAMDQTITKAIQKATIDATASTAAVTITATNAADTITVSANGSNIDAGAGFDSSTGAGGVDTFIFDDGDTMAAGGGTAVSTAANAAAALLLTDTLTTVTDGTDLINISALSGVSATSNINDQTGAALGHVATAVGSILVTQATTAGDAIVWVNTSGGDTTSFADLEEAIYIVGGAAASYSALDFVLA